MGALIDTVGSSEGRAAIGQQLSNHMTSLAAGDAGALVSTVGFAGEAVMPVSGGLKVAGATTKAMSTVTNAVVSSKAVMGATKTIERAVKAGGNQVAALSKSAVGKAKQAVATMTNNAMAPGPNALQRQTGAVGGWTNRVAEAKPARAGDYDFTGPLPANHGARFNSAGGVDLSNSPYLYPVKDGQRNIVHIEYQGTRPRDFGEANRLAGISNTQKAPIGYTWHHLDDYDPVTNTGTMQLVRREAHEATYPHKGGVKQFEDATSIKYDLPAKKRLLYDFFRQRQKNKQ